MNNLRKIHLYLGCFFAPLLVFFSVSGIWQTFGWDHSYGWLSLLTSVHTAEGVKTPWGGADLSSGFMDGFSAFMAVGLIATIILGILMAWKFGRRKLVIASLIAGFAIPATAIVIALMKNDLF